MGYLIAGVVLILVMAVLSFVFFKKELQAIIAITVFYVMYLIFIPSDFKQVGITAVNLAVGSNGEVAKLFMGSLAYLVTIGFILGVMACVVFKAIKGDRELIEIVRAIVALIVTVVTLIWIISFSVDVINLLSMKFVIPNLYNLTLWMIITVIVLATSFIDVGTNVSINTSGLRNIASIGARKRSERNADVLLYKDDLEGLDAAVLSGDIKKNRYAQIISDIEISTFEEKIGE